MRLRHLFVPGLIAAALAVAGPAGGSAAPCDGHQPDHVGTGGPDTIDIAADSIVDVNEDGLIVIDTRGGADTVIGSGAVEVVCLGPGPDTFFGGRGADRAFGQGGSDRLFGEEGSDFLHGGAGKDHLDGGLGDDTIRGGHQQDSLQGGRGDDDLDGGPGNDTQLGDRGDDIVRGAEGADDLRGGPGEDTVFGSEGNDAVRGGKGDDDLWGNEGDDLIKGGTGNDIINGDEGNDTSFGGSGYDRIWGVWGADTISGGPQWDQCGGGTQATCESPIGTLSREDHDATWRPRMNKVFKRWGIQDQVDWALEISFCESRGNVQAVNAISGTAGLFQHRPGFWDARVKRVRNLHSDFEPNFRPDADPFHPNHNITVAALLVWEGINTPLTWGPWHHWNGCGPLLDAPNWHLQ